MVVQLVGSRGLSVGEGHEVDTKKLNGKETNPGLRTSAYADGRSRHEVASDYVGSGLCRLTSQPDAPTYLVGEE
jgi:hypothetical protein